MDKSIMFKSLFDRNSIKARMIDTAARDHGYDHFELESFDPLVDLLLSALSKELERSHLYFQDTYDLVLNNLADRLVPNSMLDYRPAFGSVNIKPDERLVLNKDNFKCALLQEENKKEFLMNFVPLVNCKCEPCEVKLIANGNYLVYYEGLEKNELKRYQSDDSSIWIGISREKLTVEDQEIALFFNWFKNPNLKLYIDLLTKSRWSQNGQTINVRNGFDEYELDSERNDELWNESLTQITISKIKEELQHHYFTFQIKKDWIEDDENNVPPFIKDIIKDDANLSFANQLIWIKVELPRLPEIKIMAENIYCETNCIPVLNLNENSSTHKIRDPFKVVRLANEDYFIDIKSVETFDGKKYIPHAKFGEQGEDVIGTYKISRDGVLRINEKKAIENIRTLIDQIKEERNAYAAFKPDWIVDELNDIKAKFNRIEHKLGSALVLDPNDVFVIFVDEAQETLVRITRYTSNGVRANKISSGTLLNIKSELAFNSPDAIVVRETSGGKSYYTNEEKQLELQYLLQTRNKIVTREDIKIAIKKLMHPFKTKEIKFEKKIKKIEGAKVGFQPVLSIEIYLENEDDFQYELAPIETRIKQFLDKNMIMELPFKIKIHS